MSLNTNKEIEKKTQTNSKSKQLSIHIALLVTTLSFCLIPLILITTVLIGRTQQISKENFISTGSGLNQISMGFLNDTVNEYMATLESIVAHNDFTETNDPGYNQLKTNFIAHRDSNTSLFNVYFVGNDGTFIQTLDEELPDDLVLTELTWFKNSIAEGGKITVSSPYADVLTDTIAFSMYKAVEKNGQIIGVLALDINLSILAKELETIRYGGEGKLIVTDSKGSVLISPDYELLNTTVPTEYSSWDEVSTNTSGVTYYEYNDIAYTALYDTYELTGWKFIFMIPTQTLNTISSMTKLISIGIMILVSLICITVNTFIARRVRKSFGSMTSHIETIANGNFNTPLQLVSFISDFSFLTDHLNTMQESVGSLLKNFNQSIENVTYHTNASLEESKTVASSIDQINETMKEISEGTNESSSNLENISFHMDSLSENMNHLKVATDNVTTMATKTSSLGQSGNDISEVVRQTSAQTKISTLEVKEAIDEVSQKIDAIRLMSTTITSITEQTNLLALNATIEAARAGEAGKGFAVVASEISKLADETSSSAQKINDVVQTIEHFVSKAVEKVSETTETVNSQEKAIMQSQVIFTDIIESVHNLSEKVAEINTELANVNHMKDNVLEQVESLSSILEETAAGTEEITNSVATVQTSTDHFVDNLSQLSSMASDLTQHINNFKF